MNFCQDHWDLLREKIQAAGLMSLVADGGAEAADRMVRQLQGEEENLSNYDPLMAAMFALTNHAYGAVGPDNARRVILESHCPICVANQVHKISCSDPECTLLFERFYDNAVADEVERSKKLLGGGE